MRLDHTIVWCRDQQRSATFLAEMLGRPAQTRFIAHWADPARTRPAGINHNDGGRGVDFEDPDGHLLEVITRRYGSGPDR